MLYVIPIEPLEERYSKQWLKWTKEYLQRAVDTPFTIIHPSLGGGYSKIEQGAFLDVIKTNVYKNAQMRYLLGMFQRGYVKDGDVFWFHDLWFPGLEMLAYIRDALGIRIKIYGMLHAGTYDPFDFLTKKGMLLWGEPQETAWFRLVDGIFVATRFHKEFLASRRNTFDPSKIHVTGFPMYAEDFAYYTKTPENREPIVVFPHRLDEEKQPELCTKLHDLLKADPYTRNLQVRLTKKECSTKKEYYDLLKRAKFAVSFALQETWGIAMQEAALCGCIPIVPNRLSYEEMYPNVFKYMHNEDVYGAAERISWAVRRSDGETDHMGLVYFELGCLQNRLATDGREAFGNMMKIMGV